MYKNYFFLNRLIIDLHPLIAGKKLSEIFTQEKDKVVIAFAGEELFLEISVNPGFPYLLLKDDFRKAKKNVLSLFEEFSNSMIENIEIAEDDRIIKISLDSGIIYFTIRGKYTNLIFLDNDLDKSSFKKIDIPTLEQLADEISGKKYLSRFNLSLFSDEDETLAIQELRKKYPVIGSEIQNEVKADSSSINDFEKFIRKIEIIRNDHFRVFISEDQKIDLNPESFYYNGKELKVFKDSYDALNYLVYKTYYFDQQKNKLSLIRKALNKKLKKVSDKINNLVALSEKENRSEEYQKTGNLILINLNSVKEGMNLIEVDDIYSDEKIEIKLDTKKNGKQNADNYFEKARNEKTLIENAKQRLKAAKTEFSKLKEIEVKIDETLSLKQLDEIIKNLKIKQYEMQEQQEDITKKFKHYLIENKYKVFVGKDSKSNDLLTQKFAKQNDLWFHARSVSGSHTVLKVENKKEVVPKNILKSAASIAAFHSKAKTAGTVPVVYTFKKYVVKKKGDPVGTVRLLKENVLLVKPEIPVNCEFVSSD